MMKHTMGIIAACSSEDKELEIGDCRNIIDVYVVKYLYFIYMKISL